MTKWIEVAAEGAINIEDVMRFDFEKRTFAVYRSNEGDYYCTDGLCTHEDVHLADGFVMDCTIECPKHGGIFDFTSGEAVRVPACVDLKTYPVKTEGGRIFIDIA